MVNNTRQFLLETFQNSSSWISGETLSRTYGISRVAIWKHIKALRNEGYHIESGHRGYKLLDGDNLTTMDFDPSEKILFYKELTSTMREAQIRLLNAPNEPEDFIILADHQSGGRGRDEASWPSPSGGIYMTCVLNKPLPMEDASLLPLRGILSVLQVLDERGAAGISFLWPGDIVIGENKIGGILDEYYVKEGEIIWYALGIGLYLKDPQKENPDVPLSSITEITGQDIKRKDFIRRFKAVWQTNLTQPSTSVIREISRYSPFLGKPILIETRQQGTIEGIAQSIDEKGCLHVVSENSFRITFGESIKFLIGEEDE